MDLERFVNRQNIERYRRLSCEATDANERVKILRLLAEELAKFRQEMAVPAERRAEEQQGGNSA